jgi:hypothetical protein
MSRIRQTTRVRLRQSAMAIGVVFLVAGIAGFIPGLTTDLHLSRFAGHHSGASLFGVFAVSVLHNLVHIAFGAAGLALSRTTAGARTYLIGGGAVYLLLWLYGVVIDLNSPANFIPLNEADNCLHFFLGVVMITLGLVFGRRARPAHWTR